MTEDYLVTLRLKERGYLTVYLNERLTLGLAPEGLRSTSPNAADGASASCKS